MSALCSVLLTIGPRFGGASGHDAKMFSQALDSGISTSESIGKIKKTNQRTMGIGHRIKPLSHPDQRVEFIKQYAKKHFKNTAVLDFSLRASC